MKGCILILLFVFCYGDCRKVLPINKSANTDFINMEAGGIRGAPASPAPAKPSSAQPVQPAPSSPQGQQTPTLQQTPPTPPKPVSPKQEPTPNQISPKPSPPNQISPKPVNPPQSATPITTPGPGSVKQLITFYDSQGKGSPIRPYSYSQAVKQG